MTLAEMRAKYYALMGEARALLAVQTRSAEQNTTIENKFTEARALANDIKLMQEAEDAATEQRSQEQAAEQRARAGRPELPQPGAAAGTGTDEQRAANQAQIEERNRQYDSALRTYVRTGRDEELRAMSTAPGPNGGYAIPVTLVPDVERAILAYGGIAAAVRTLNTSAGETINYPLSNDTANMAVSIAENTDADEQDLVLSQKPLTVDTLTTRMVKISRQLLQDSAFDFAQFINDNLSERSGRGLSYKLTNGGTAFDSIVTSAVAGHVSATPTDIGLTDIAGLFGNVDPGYASNGKFAMNRRTQIYLSTLRNQLGAPIFQVDASGLLTKLFGADIAIDQNLPDIGAGNRAVFFGDWSKYILRRVPGMEIMRLDERFATANQVAFLGFFRAGGIMLDAGTHPIQCLVQHA